MSYLKLKLHNSLTKSDYIVENFELMTMYVCGPTLYNELHIGNGRSLVVFDVFFRVFNYLFEKVIYVRNITDIDDKIVQKSMERGISAEMLVNEYEVFYKRDLNNLNILPPTYEPKATFFLPQMIEYIKKLQVKDYAYVTKNKNVYFEVSKLEDYNFFQNIDALKEEARVINKEDKKNWKDFALWKGVTDNYGYESPWGYGRPGWHLECSVMSNHYLGDNFMLHGGGEDLAFPHHHNEIAQGMGYANKCCSELFVHNGLICLKGNKMSKSLGNIITISSIAQSKYHGDILRYIYISTYYNSNLNFTDDILINSTNIINKIREFKYKNIHLRDNKKKEVYMEHLLNYMNIPETMSHLFSLMSDANNYNIVMNTWQLLGFDLGIRQEVDSAIIANLIEKRQEAKLEKNYELSDSIRKELESYHIKVQDSKDEQIWFYM
jgi:cysteinyl-tRNA synthetase